MSAFYKNLALVLLFVVVSVLIFNLFNPVNPSAVQIPFSDVMDKIQNGEVNDVTIKGSEMFGNYKTGKSFKTNLPEYPDLVKDLRARGVKINAEPVKESAWYNFLVVWAPLILMAVWFMFIMRNMQMGGNKAMSFGKSKAKLLNESTKKVTFNEVAGMDEAKVEVQEIIEILKDPQKFQKLGGKIPKGVLLVGPPGTGKTLLARAIAGEAGVPFLSISGSDFVEMFVGVGASRVRDLFEQGKKNAPCIIFIDEIDAVGRHRGAGLGGGHDEREQTLNQLLVEMDGFESNEGVILVAATNRPDVLDPALLRPGRFDRMVVLPRPDLNGRIGVLKVHTQKIKLAPNVDIESIARGTPGLSGAELANLVNEAALLAGRMGKTQVENDDFDRAKDKILMGLERKSMLISDEEKKNTAYHEAGHTMVARLIPGTDPVHKVSIIPRGMALGVTLQLPTADRYSYDREHLLNNIAILLGGRAAEEIALKHMTTGAGNDLERATALARKMVCEWGMSDAMGPLSYGKKEEQIFLGREIAQHRDYSEHTALEIDNEVKRIVMDNYHRAKTLIQEREAVLHGLAKALLEKETLDAADIDEIVNGQPTAA
ncbi:MAG TPA: ATP-dependent zinc metalloprotease FtsH [Nitrospirota bacterium]|nr:ATP-dependent zinc metalloprotease FtsH [Nitrospirota bacterium]